MPSKLLVIDNLESFTLVPYFRKHLTEILGPDAEVATMRNLFTQDSWAEYERHNPTHVFIDFCNESATVLTNKCKDLEAPPKIVIRLHGYESVGRMVNGQKSTPLLDHVYWPAVTALVTVSDHLRMSVAATAPAIAPRLHTVPNGIDLDKFQLQPVEGMDPKQIAYAGFFNKAKGISLLRTLFFSLPEYQFHLAGTFQEQDVLEYLRHARAGNEEYHGWVQTAEFLKGKRFILCTSIQETFGMSIAEGMAMGLTPAIHWWPGAENIWPREFLWRSFDELRAILATPRPPEKCRAWIEERYSMTRCVSSISDLLFA